MHHALNWLWQGLVVALVTFVALRALYRARPHARCVLCWAAVIATLVLPLLPLVPEWPSPDAAAGAALSTEGAAPLAIPHAWWTSSLLMLLAWAGWMGLSGARVAAAVRRLHDARRRSRTFPADLEARLECWMAVRERGRQAHLVLTDDVGAAAVLGCGAPIIAVAPALLERLDVDEIDRVVVHEWAHVQRRDDLLQLAEAAVRVVAGWHPAVYWLLRQLSLEREAACDAMAVDVTGCPRRYAASLAAVACARSNPRRLAIAAGILSATPLRIRIRRILSMQQLASAKLSAAAVAAGVLIIGVLATEIAARPLVHAPAIVIARLETSPPPDVLIDAPVVPAVEPPAPTAIPGPAVVQRRAIQPVSLPSSPAPDSSATLAPPPGSELSAPELFRDDPLKGSESPDHSDPPDPSGPAGSDVVATAPAVASAEMTDKPDPAPWIVASNAAVAVARGSGRAATATSGFFTRASRRLASAF